MKGVFAAPRAGLVTLLPVASIVRFSACRREAANRIGTANAARCQAFMEFPSQEKLAPPATGPNYRKSKIGRPVSLVPHALGRSRGIRGSTGKGQDRIIEDWLRNVRSHMDTKQPTTESPRGRSWQPVLRRLDQVTVAALVSAALAGMGVYWFVQGGPRGELIEIDCAEPLTARYLVDINKAGCSAATRLELLADLVFRACDLPEPPRDYRATPGVDAAER